MSLTGYNPYTYTPGFRNQEFHHAVLSVSGTWHTLYLDGVQVAQNLSGGNVFASYQTITNTVIGAQTTLAQAFQGTIGDVRVYNYAIPATTVSNLYRDRNLVVYYPFDTSVNALTPNYATLIYDASLIGQPLITASAGANVGSGALALTNTAGAVATQYVKTTPGIAGQVGWNLNTASGITIACWINVAGVAGRIQRIFDIPLSVGTKGLAVDISGTNMLYSGWNAPLIALFTDLTTIPGLTLWLDAASASNFTFSSGSNISTWLDKSGKGYNATANAGSATRTTKNGINTIFFGDQVKMTINTSFIINASFTIFVVLQCTSGTSNVNLVLYPGASTGPYIYVANNAQNISVGINNVNLGTTANYTTTNFALLTYQVNSTTAGDYVMNLNGSNSGSITTPSAISAGTNYIIQGGNNGLNISEMVCYSSNKLTAYQYQQVEGYLAWKWGLQTSLPAYHPYYSAAPVAVSTTFLPTIIPGMTLWLDANNSAVFTYSASNITQWADKSGIGNNAIAVNSNFTLATINGKNTVNFPRMTFNNAYPPGTTTNAYFRFSSLKSDVFPMTFFAVCCFTGVSGADNGNATNFLWVGSISNALCINQNYGTNQLLLTKYGGAPYTSTTGTLSSSNLQIVTVQVASTGSYIININGTSSLSGNATFLTTSSLAYIIGYAGMNISEINLYNSALTTYQYQQVEGYLAWKWGLQSSLPNNHPYKTTAPTNIAPSGVTIPSSSYSIYNSTSGTPAAQTTLISWTSVASSTTNYTATITNYPYPSLNGTYFCSASSTTSNITYYENVYNAFDGYYSTGSGTSGNNYSWFSGTTTYSATSPYTYTGGISTSNVNGGSYSNSSVGGEWIQLQMPNSVIIKGFSFYPSGSNTNTVLGVVLVGSNNGTSWNFLSSYTSPSYAPLTLGSLISVSFTNNTAYSYYRVIVTNANLNGAAIAVVAINEIIFDTGINPLTSNLAMHFPFNNSSIDIISGTDYFSGTRSYKTSTPSPIFSPSYLDVTTNKLLNSNANLTQLNTNTLSFSCWMAFPSASLGNSGYYMIAYETTNDIGITITNKAYNATSGQGSNAISLEFYPGEVRINIIPSVIANQWYHIVFTINNTILNVYIDGIPLSGPVNAGTNSSTYTVTFPHTLIRSYISTIYKALGFGCSLNGSLPQTCYFDDVRFYNRILSPSDVTAIYNYRGGTTEDLLNPNTYIWLDSASSYVVQSGNNVTTWNDRSPNGFNLTPVSNPNPITYNSTSPTSVTITTNGTYLTGSYFNQTTASKFNMLTSLQTWFFVISGVGPTSDARLVGINSSVNLIGFDFLIQNNRFFVYSHGGSNGEGIGFSSTFSASTKYLISVSLNLSSPSFANALTNSIMRLNGTTITTGNYPTGAGYLTSYNLSGSSLSLVVGSLAINNTYYSSSNPFNIHEIIGINTQAFNLTNIKTVENYLNAKWNLGYTIT